MKTHRHGIRTSRSGFTLLESVIAAGIFSVVGYSVAQAVRMGNHSQTTVMQVALGDRALRAATSSLVDDLRSSADAQITVTTLGDGNHQVRYMIPIMLAGVPGWGVYDPTLGPDAATQNRPNWSIQYTVRTVIGANGGPDKQLVRQVLDDTLAVKKEKVIIDGLRTGFSVPPGFKMVKTGSVWQITLSTLGSSASTTGITAVFDVHTRN
jgi:type II secretory pathway pseudopilin PulG